MSNNMSYVFDLSCLDISCNKRAGQKVSTREHPRIPTGPAQFRQPEEDEVILYYYHNSYYSQVVLMALFHRQIPFTGQALDIRKGDQFCEDFLNLCPRGEVPVFHDGITNQVFTDSLEIIKHLEESPLLGAMGHNLYPDDPTERFRCDEFSRKLHRLKLDTVTFGSVLYDDLGTEPTGQFQTEEHREIMREYIRHRRAIYRTEALNYPQHGKALRRKLDDIQHEWHYFESRQDFERLLLSFERELDECEAELGSRHHRGHHPTHAGTMLGNDNWWLCAQTECIADIFLAILLWRLYELGFYKRMIAPRPHLVRYFERMQARESFQSTTHPVNLDELKSTPSSMDIYQKRIPWYLLAIPITTMIIYAIWGYRTRRTTNSVGFYAVAAASFIYAKIQARSKASSASSSSSKAYLPNPHSENDS